MAANGISTLEFKRDRQDAKLALASTARDPALRTRLGAAAESKVREHFDHQASVRQLMNLFAGPGAGSCR